VSIFLEMAYGIVCKQLVTYLFSWLLFIVLYYLQFKNDFMGFADFRARLTSDSMGGFDVTPNEGSCSKTPTDLSVRFMPQSMGVSEATLVIETEDQKHTYKLTGTTG
jgi:hypothetical protein